MAVKFNPTPWLISLYRFFFRRFPARPSRAAQWSRSILLVLTFLPFLLVWLQPSSWFYSILGLLVINVIIWWWHWPGVSSFRSWLVGGGVFTLWCGSIFALWFFLEGSSWRIIYLLLTGGVSFWYLAEWQRVARKLVALEIGAGATITLIMTFLAILALVSTAQYLLILFDWSIWTLLLVFFLPQLLLYAGWLESNGWSLLDKWQYCLLGAVVLGQVFVLVLWWPNGPYSTGLVSSLLYLVVALTVRQEAQRFINLREFRREIILVLVLLAVVLATVRWL